MEVWVAVETSVEHTFTVIFEAILLNQPQAKQPQHLLLLGYIYFVLIVGFLICV